MLICRPIAALAAMLLIAVPARAQMPPGGPPSVGVRTVAAEQVTETVEANGRIQAIYRVELSARVSAFLEAREFQEGAEVKNGDLMFRLERGPFEADVEAKHAAVAQAEAQLDNAILTLARAEQLLKNATGSQSTYDNAVAAKKSAAAQLRAAKAQLWQSQINLDYTEIRSPIDGRVGRANVSIGNVVGPSSGSLASIVSEDPIYVAFNLPVRRLLELRDRVGGQQGLNSLRLRVRRPDGRFYGEVGKIDFLDISTARDTDTIMLRGVIKNLALPGGGRQLTHDELIRVVLETGQTREALTIPRVAVLTDQQGDYVFVVGANNLAQQRRVKLGQSTAETAVVLEGLTPGDTVVVEGVQRVRANAPVAPLPLAHTSDRPTQLNVRN